MVDGYAILQPRVTPSLPVGREGSLLPARLLRRQRDGPLRGGRLRCLSGPVRRRLVHRQGHLRRRRLRGRAGRARARKRTAQPRPVRRHLRARRPGRPMSRWSRSFRRATTSPRRASTAGRAATGSCCRGSSGRKDAAAATGTRASARVPLIGLWKMLDNLRRSLSAPSSVAALLAGWLLPSAGGIAVDGVHCGQLAVPALLPAFAGIVPRRAGITLRSHLYALRQDIALAAAQTAFLLAFLADQAWLMGDAIARTLFRLFVTRRNLLEWMTAAQSPKTAARSARLLPHDRRAAGGRRGGHYRGDLRPRSRRAGRTVHRCCGSLAPALALWISASSSAGGGPAVSSAGRDGACA